MNKDNIVIEIKELSKKYLLGKAGKADTFREALSASFSNIFKNFQKEAEYIWALNNINLKITQGEVLGIIGKNGAGKSTLLKILSRITAPTSGESILHGRVASLLEVGSGFHPELTGRENIFLNAAILGMKHSEIKKNSIKLLPFQKLNVSWICL